MVLCDGAYATLLGDRLPAGLLVDELIERDPNAVLDAHRAYIDAGARRIHSPTLTTCRLPDRVRRGRYVEAIAILREAAAGSQCELAVTMGASSDEPRRYWADLELVMELGIDRIAWLTVTSSGEALACARAWSDVVVGNGCSATATLSLGLWDRKPPSGDTPSINHGMVKLCEQLRACGLDRQLELGLNCGWGIEGLHSAAETLSDAWGAPIHLAPSTGVGDVRASRDEWCDELRALARPELVSSYGGCCGTDPTWIGEL